MVGRLFSTGGNGGLKQSIKETVKGNDDKGYEIRSQMKDYGYFQDSGVRGTGGTSTRKLYGKKKGTVKTTSWKNRVRHNEMSLNKPGQFTTAHPVIGGSLPFGARFVIRRIGLKPKPFVKPSVLNVMDKVGYDMIAEATAEDVALEFTNTFKNAKIG